MEELNQYFYFYQIILSTSVWTFTKVENVNNFCHICLATLVVVFSALTLLLSPMLVLTATCFTFRCYRRLGQLRWNANCLWHRLHRVALWTRLPSDWFLNVHFQAVLSSSVTFVVGLLAQLRVHLPLVWRHSVCHYNCRELVHWERFCVVQSIK